MVTPNVEDMNVHLHLYGTLTRSVLYMGFTYCAMDAPVCVYDLQYVEDMHLPHTLTVSLRRTDTPT